MTQLVTKEAAKVAAYQAIVKTVQENQARCLDDAKDVAWFLHCVHENLEDCLNDLTPFIVRGIS